MQGEAILVSEKVQSQLGMRLREARERRGISIAQAAAETRILQRYLLALEEGDYHHLPGDVYARGFIRNYAQYLNLPAEELVEIYRAERGGSAPIRVIPAAVPPKTRSCLAPSVFIVFFLVAVLAVGAYLVANALGLTRTNLAGLATATPTQIATPQPLPTASPGPTSSASSATPQPSEMLTPIVSSPTITPTTGPAAPLVVDLRVTNAESWMRIIVDGRIVVQGLRSPGWSERFQAQREIRVRAGNAGSVEVSLNGGPFERMGGAGQVRDLVFTP